jgi:hypothetical protein
MESDRLSPVESWAALVGAATHYEIGSLTAF